MFVILVPNLTAKLVLRPKDDLPLLGRDYKLECKLTPGPYAYSSKFKFTYEWFDVLRKGDKQIVKERDSLISFEPFLHAEDTSTEIQNLTITIVIIFPPAAPRSITIFSAQFKLSFLKQALSSLP